MISRSLPSIGEPSTACSPVSSQSATSPQPVAGATTPTRNGPSPVGPSLAAKSMPWFSFQLPVGNKEGARCRLEIHAAYLLQNGVTEVRFYVPRTAQQEISLSVSTRKDLIQPACSEKNVSGAAKLEDGVQVALYSAIPKSLEGWQSITEVLKSTTPQSCSIGIGAVDDHAKDSAIIGAKPQTLQCLIRHPPSLTIPPSLPVPGSSAILNSPSHLSKSTAAQMVGGVSSTAEGATAAMAVTIPFRSDSGDTIKMQKPPVAISLGTGTSDTASEGTSGAAPPAALAQPRSGSIGGCGFRPLGGSGNLSIIQRSGASFSTPVQSRSMPFAAALSAPHVALSTSAGQMAGPRIVPVTVSVWLEIHRMVCPIHFRSAKARIRTASLIPLFFWAASQITQWEPAVQLVPHHRLALAPL